MTDRDLNEQVHAAAEKEGLNRLDALWNDLALALVVHKEHGNESRYDNTEIYDVWWCQSRDGSGKYLVSISWPFFNVLIRNELHDRGWDISIISIYCDRPQTEESDH